MAYRLPLVILSWYLGLECYWKSLKTEDLLDAEAFLRKKNSRVLLFIVAQLFSFQAVIVAHYVFSVGMDVPQESPEEMVAQVTGYEAITMHDKRKPTRMPRFINGDGSKKEEWSNSAVFCLLDIYADKYSSLRRGSLSGRDWDEVAAYVNSQCKELQGAKTSDQCKYKIENMKRRYKTEQTKKIANASVKILWPYFSKMEQILGFPSRQTGIPGGVDAGSFLQVNEQSAHEGLSMLECRATHEMAEESQAESEAPKLKRPFGVIDSDQDQEDPLADPTSCMKDGRADLRQGFPPRGSFSNNIPGSLRGRSSSKQQKVSASDVGRDVANSIRGFADVMLRIEQAKMDLMRELERQRAETELKRTEMLLNSQMEIVRMLSKRWKKGSDLGGHTDSD